MEKQYKAVFFDLGGTLRIAFLEEAYMRHARRKWRRSQARICLMRNSIR